MTIWKREIHAAEGKYVSAHGLRYENK